MFPARFEYRSPTSFDAALAALADGGEDARVLAGGQSLIPMMKLRFATPSLLVDLGRVPGLDHIEEAGGRLRIGAMTRTAQLEASELVKRRYPTIAAAAPQISDPLVRNLGTLGGSLAHADPAGDWGSVMMALGAEVVLVGPSGERVLPVEEFIEGTFTTALEPGEILTEVRVPEPAERSGGAYLKLERKVGDFATVGVAVFLELDGSSSGRPSIGRAGIGLTAVGSKNIKATAAERALAGVEPSSEAFEEAGRLAAEAADPVSDVRGSSEYKRAVVRAFVKRGLQHALEHAQNGG